MPFVRRCEMHVQANFFCETLSSCVAAVRSSFVRRAFLSNDVISFARHPVSFVRRCPGYVKLTVT